MSRLTNLCALVLAAGLPVLAQQSDVDRGRVNLADGLVYVWIPSGSYSMGCSPGDTECFDWEEPTRVIELREGFWIGQTEVTQAAYEKVMGISFSLYRGASLPADSLSWNEASAYCEAVGMRLPTEIEWEYAARGGSSAARRGALNSVAWFDGNSSDKTHPVAQKGPNGFGLYDTLGNVWEWVQDEYRGSGESQRILRGGSFYNVARDLRVSNRLWASPETAHRNMGVRCAGD